MHRKSSKVLMIVAAFMLLLIPIGAIAAGPSFSDVPVDDWAYDDIEWLAATGVTKGCGDGTTFCPDDSVTRRQMAAFMHRLATYKVVDAKTSDNADTLDGHDSAFFTRNDGYSVWHDAAIDIPSDFETALGLSNVPAGSYVFIAKTWFHHGGTSGSQFAQCKLVAGSELDQTVATVANPNDGIPATWTVAATLVAPANSVVLSCRDYGNDVTLNDTKITGIRLDSMTNQQG